MSVNGVIFQRSIFLTENARDYYSRVLQSHEETWIKFDWGDIRYIIVLDEIALKRIIDSIKKLPLEDAQNIF